MALTTNGYDEANSKTDDAPSLIFSTVRNYLSERYGPLRNRDKVAANDASYGGHKVSHHTARGWFNQRKPTMPCMQSVEIMCARNPELLNRIEKARERLRVAISK